MLLLIGLILLIIGITKLSKANTIKKEAYELEQKNDEKLNKLHDRERFILSKEETQSDLNKHITMLKNDIILLKKEKEDLNDEINQKYDETSKNKYSSIIISNMEEIKATEIYNSLILLKLKIKKDIIDEAVCLPLSNNKRKIN
ncbi:DUF4041 domain-containing protein, partial [Enterococcus faecium]|nr:DUF4041 domain-containing protein [Enterococcus faecium]